MKMLEPFTCRLDIEQVRQIDAVGKARGLNRAETIRLAIDNFLRGPDSRFGNPYRIAQTTEYMQAVADLLLKQQMPEKRDAIIALVTQRLEQYHGTR